MAPAAQATSRLRLSHLDQRRYIAASDAAASLALEGRDRFLQHLVGFFGAEASRRLKAPTVRGVVRHEEVLDLLDAVAVEVRKLAHRGLFDRGFGDADQTIGTNRAGLLGLLCGGHAHPPYRFEG